MSWQKRICDIALASVLLVLLLVPMLFLSMVLLIRQGRPLFYVSERMKGLNQPFRLWKLRTMIPAADDGQATGGHKADRITKTGQWLRRTRLDEVPQLWNILRGDMSFVGPRPPLRVYTERFPGVYGAVLRSRPGLTGLATLTFHRREAQLMSEVASPAESDGVYARRCVPTKARLDLIYQRRQSLLFDFALMLRTIGVVLGRERKH